jgi:hypothetical protein
LAENGMSAMNDSEKQRLLPSSSSSAPYSKRVILYVVFKYGELNIELLGMYQMQRPPKKRRKKTKRDPMPKHLLILVE